MLMSGGLISEPTEQGNYQRVSAPNREVLRGWTKLCNLFPRSNEVKEDVMGRKFITQYIQKMRNAHNILVEIRRKKTTWE